MDFNNPLPARSLIASRTAGRATEIGVQAQSNWEEWRRPELARHDPPSDVFGRENMPSSL